MWNSIARAGLVGSLLILTFPLFSQSTCPASISAGTDTLLCDPQTVGTQAEIESSRLDVLSWLPLGTVMPQNTADLSPTIAITETTWITLEAEFYAAQNLVVNGDFSQGNTGFTSDYNPGNSTSPIGPLAGEGQYLISDNPQSTHSGFAPCEDHTPGAEDNMMVVNGSPVDDARIYCQTVSVTPGTDLRFEAWFATVVPQNPARLYLTVNGIAGPEFTISTVNCAWEFHEFLVTDPVSSTLEICIRNANTLAMGNDFAIDDVGLYERCTATDSFLISLLEPLNPEFELPQELYCLDGDPLFLVLDDLLLPTSTPGGDWLLSGGPLGDTLDFYTIAQGVYELFYVVTEGTCSAQSSRPIEMRRGPMSGTAMETPLFCRDTGEEVNLADFLIGADPGGTWTPPAGLPAGVFDAALGRLSTNLIIPGTYLFDYTVTGNNSCPDQTTTVTITILPSPVINLNLPPPEELEITCLSPILASYSYASFNQDTLLVNWTFPDGSILINPDSIVIDQPGNYVYLLTDLINGCTDRAEFFVEDGRRSPPLEVAVVPPTCQALISNGAIVVADPLDGLGPYLFRIGDQPYQPIGLFPGLPGGEYIVGIQDINGCENNTTVVLPEPDNFTVDLTASTPETRLPLGTAVTLSLQTSLLPGQLDTILWFPPLPDCDDGCTRANLRLTGPATYVAIVFDTTGCAVSDSISFTTFFNQDIYVPSAFSPNDDGVNDVFEVFGGPSVTGVQELLIFDKWGGLIHQSGTAQSEFRAAWDGRQTGTGKPAPTGVYLYTAGIELVTGEVVRRSGSVTLVR